MRLNFPMQRKDDNFCAFSISILRSIYFPAFSQAIRIYKSAVNLYFILKRAMTMEHQGQLHPLLGHFRNHHDQGTDNLSLHQHFANGLLAEDLPPLDTWAMMHPHSRRILSNKEKSAISEISCTKDEFRVTLDVHQFRPEELNAKVVDNYVVVQGKHDNREDAHGYISRHFQRRYSLPDNVKDEQLVIDLSSDGILQIRVPRLDEAHHHDPSAAKKVPINQTGRPAIATGATKRSCDANGHHFHSLNS